MDNKNITLSFSETELSELYITLNKVLACKRYEPTSLFELREQIETSFMNMPY